MNRDPQCEKQNDKCLEVAGNLKENFNILTYNTARREIEFYAHYFLKR